MSETRQMASIVIGNGCCVLNKHFHNRTLGCVHHRLGSKKIQVPGLLLVPAGWMTLAESLPCLGPQILSLWTWR